MFRTLGLGDFYPKITIEIAVKKFNNHEDHEGHEVDVNTTKENFVLFMSFMVQIGTCSIRYSRSTSDGCIPI